MDRTKKIYCCNCEEDINCELKTGLEIYPHREDLKPLRFWQCPNCGGYIGTHKHSRKHAPLGCIPTPELKEWRIKTHKVIDDIWRNKEWCSRISIYQSLSSKFGYPFHVGFTKTIEECQQAIKHAVEYGNQKLQERITVKKFIRTPFKEYYKFKKQV